MDDVRTDDGALVSKYGLPPLEHAARDKDELIKAALIHCDDASNKLGTIMSGLTRALELRDFYRGCSVWRESLSSYLDLHLPIPLSTRAEFARICHAFVVCQGSPSIIRQKFAQMLARLLRSRTRPSGQTMELILPWRHIYDILNVILFKKQRSDLFMSSCGGSLVHAARFMRRFFDHSASNAIFEELIPRMCIHDEYNMFCTQGMMVSLMPMNSPHHGLWLNFVFTIWDCIENTNGWDVQWMLLIGRLAQTIHGTRVGIAKATLCPQGTCQVCDPVRETHNGNSLPFDWEAHLPSLFSRFLRVLELPVGSGTRYEPRKHEMPSITKVFASWAMSRTAVMMGQIARIIVYTATSPSTITHFKQFIHLIESWYHPSNVGRWSTPLATLLLSLSETMANRVGIDYSIDSQLPDDERITKECVVEFVQCLLPLSLLALFNKSSSMVNAAVMAIKHLASIAPCIVLPLLLDRVCGALTTVTETHQTAAAFEVLATTARSVVMYADRSTFISILDLALPGIDPNDAHKTLATIRFFTEIMYQVPLWDDGDMDDVSDELKAFVEAVKWEHPLGWPVVSDPMPYLGEWAIATLNKVFELITVRCSSSNGLDGDEKATRRDQQFDGYVHHFLWLMFAQMGTQLYAKCLDKTLEFCMENILSGSEASHMLNAACQRVDIAVPHVLPRLLDKVMYEVDGMQDAMCHNHVPQTAYALHPLSKTELKWYLRLISQTIRHGGPALVPFSHHLIHIISLVSTHEIRSVCKYGGKILRHALTSLTHVYPTSFSSVPSHLCHHRDPRLIGVMMELKNTHMQWHVPNQDELECAATLVCCFVTRPLSQFKPETVDYDDGFFDAKTPSSDEQYNSEVLWRQFVFIQNGLRGCSGVLGELPYDTCAKRCDDIWLSGDECGDSMLNRISHTLDSSVLSLHEQCIGVSADIRMWIGQTLITAASHVLAHHEDSPHLLKITGKIINDYVTNRGIQRHSYNAMSRFNNAAKKVFTDHVMGRRRLPRAFWSDQCHALYTYRVAARGDVPYHAINSRLSSILFGISLCRYLSVRKRVQKYLQNVCSRFPCAAVSVLRGSIDVLMVSENDSQDSVERVKGALHLLGSPSISSRFADSWETVNKLIHSLVRARQFERNCIQSQIVRVFGLFTSTVDQLPTHSSIASGYDILCQMKHGTTPLQDAMLTAMLRRGIVDIEARTTAIETLRARDTESRLELVRSLVESKELTSTSIHWRFKSILCGTLVMLLRPDLPSDSNPASVLPYLLDRTVSLELMLRSVAIKGVVVSLAIFKPMRARVVDTECTGKEVTEWMEQWSGDECSDEEVVFRDQVYYGWMGKLPKDVERYVKRDEQPSTATLPASLQQYHSSIDAYRGVSFEEPVLFQAALTVTSSDYCHTVLQRRIAEASRPGSHFIEEVAQFFKSIFQSFELLTLKNFMDEVEQLIEQPDSSTDVRGRRIAAAEVVAGCGRGCKHWHVSDQNRVWEWIAGIFAQMIPHCGGDGIDVWISALQFLCHRYDPRRFAPLLKLLFSDAAFEFNGSALVQSVRLELAAVCLAEVKWRGTALGIRCIEMVKEHMANPYKHIRDSICGMLSVVFEISHTPAADPTPQLMSFVGWVSDQLHILYRQREEQMVGNDTHYDKTHTECFRKCVLGWLSMSYGDGFGYTITPYIEKLLPALFRTSDDSDPDLAKKAAQCLSLVAQSHVTSITGILHAMRSVISDRAWHVRQSVLPFLQVFVYQHASQLNNDTMQLVLDMVMTLLNDSVTEVRHEASTALAGIIKVTPSHIVDSLEQQFREWSGPPVPKRRRRFDKYSKPGPQIQHDIGSEIKRHAGLLGLISLVLSHPFDIPESFPELLLFLAQHITDPSHSVSASVRSAFREFWRTHQDTWALTKALFSEDQLAELTELLVAPTCFI